MNKRILFALVTLSAWSATGAFAGSFECKKVGNGNGDGEDTLKLTVTDKKAWIEGSVRSGDGQRNKSYHPRDMVGWIRYEGFRDYCDEGNTTVTVEPQILQGESGNMHLANRGEGFFDTYYNCQAVAN